MDIYKFIIISVAVIFQAIGVTFFILEYLKNKKNFGWLFFVLGLILEIYFFCLD